MRPAKLVMDVVGELQGRLRRRFGASVRDVRLFGSHARGEADAGSDVDVLVVLDCADWGTRREALDMAADVGLPHDLLVSLTILDQRTFERWQRQRRPLVTDIERDGIRP